MVRVLGSLGFIGLRRGSRVREARTKLCQKKALALVAADGLELQASALKIQNVKARLESLELQTSARQFFDSPPGPSES